MGQYWNNRLMALQTTQAPEKPSDTAKQACKVTAETSLDRVETVALLLKEDIAKGRMIGIFDGAIKTTPQVDCSSVTDPTSKQSCQDIASIETEALRALKDATRNNGNALQKYLLSCDGPTDKSILVGYTTVREDLFKIFLLLASDTIKNPEAMKLLLLKPQDRNQKIEEFISGIPDDTARGNINKTLKMLTDPDGKREK